MATWHSVPIIVTAFNNFEVVAERRRKNIYIEIFICYKNKAKNFTKLANSKFGKNRNTV